MYVLKIANSSPEIYIGIVSGFFEKVETVNQAFQLARQSDAQALQDILVDGTEVVSI